MNRVNQIICLFQFSDSNSGYNRWLGKTSLYVIFLSIQPLAVFHLVGDLSPLWFMYAVIHNRFFFFFDEYLFHLPWNPCQLLHIWNLLVKNSTSASFAWRTTSFSCCKSGSHRAQVTAPDGGNKSQHLHSVQSATKLPSINHNYSYISSYGTLAFL